MSSPRKLETCAQHTLSATDDKKEERAKRLHRAQWLRAAILGANDGLLSNTSLMLGVGAAIEDQWSMILSGLAGALAGAFSMAVGEFVSVSTQRDIEIAAIEKCSSKDEETEALPNPYRAAFTSAGAFLCGSIVPMVAAVAVANNLGRIIAIVVVTSIALALFGGIGAYLGGLPLRVSAARVLAGGWISMVITYGLLKPLES
ncbi:hypothetical protein LguiA_005545 [Lonicera macranthoides]